MLNIEKNFFDSSIIQDQIYRQINYEDMEGSDMDKLYKYEGEIILPVYPMPHQVIFPDHLARTDDTRTYVAKAIELAMEKDRFIFCVNQIQNLDEDEDLLVATRKVGTIAVVKQAVKNNANWIGAVLEGLVRAEIEEYEFKDGIYQARLKILEEIEEEIEENEKEAYLREAKELAKYIILADRRYNNDSNDYFREIDDLGYLSDAIGNYLVYESSKKQEILDLLNITDRIKRAIQILSVETEIVQMQNKLSNKVKKKLDKHQKEYILREQLKTIQNELRELSGTNEKNISLEENEIEEFSKKAKTLRAPKYVKEKFEKELARMKYLSPSSPEYAVIRTYLERLIEYPWWKSTKENLNLKEAKKILDEDHYGLNKIKERIIEHLAVRKLTKNNNTPILCLVGPPGTGKTSIAKSIARALNRNYQRISLGGINDEADIRGHRRTYVASMPGRIVAAMNRAASNNPLLLLDELDKIGASHKGDPAAALLEVLDGEQNKAFEDHYMEIPVDLSNVLFFATANTLSTIPRPLMDRIEIIEVSSYTSNEKFHIAKKYLMPKQLKKHGLNEEQLKISDKAIRNMIEFYTKEAGVRNLERKISEICRKAAKEIMLDGKKSVFIKTSNIEKYLGNPRYRYENMLSEPKVGLARGLAWTQVGGDTLSVEVVKVPGKGDIKLTGRLGNVMKESASAAMSYLQSKTKEYGLESGFNKKLDIHIHIPEGAVPKDGPSAGITMALAIYSAITGKYIKNDIAMTGEITLSGRVLAIGGLKEKILAAKRAGIKDVIVPKGNQEDVKEFDKEVVDNINIHYVEDMSQVIELAIVDKKEKTDGNK